MLNSRRTIPTPNRTIPTLPETAGPGTPHGADAAREAGLDARSSGREELIARVLDVCTARPGRQLVMITGPAGIGRSWALAQLRARLSGLDVSTADIRASVGDRDFAGLVGRIADELGAPPVRGESGAAAVRRLSAAPIRGDRLVVLIDDAHRLAPECLTAGLDALAGDRITFVCTATTPNDGSGGDLASLRARGLVHEERLRPLPVSAVDHILTSLLGAKPAPGLAAELRDACRGVPALVHAAIEGYLAADRLRVVDRQAHLIGTGAPRLSITHPLFAALRDPATWAVAKALSVLHPLGEAAPALIAATAGIGEDEVLGVLRELRASGVVTFRNGWRFRVPMLAALLTACLGPYERSRSAQLAVTAIWERAATCPDDGYLPDRIVDAGRLVDAERAAAELLAHGEAAPEDARAVRWRWAACGLIADPARRAAALHRHSVLCAQHQKLAPAAEAAEAALRDHHDWLAADSSQELQIIAAAGLASNGNTAALSDIAAVGWHSGGDATRLVTRAAALCLLNRWSDARDELLAGHGTWNAGGTGPAAFGQAIAEAAVAVAGGTAPTASSLAVEAARTLLRALGLGSADAPADGGAVRAARSGQWDRSLDLARAAIASASLHGDPPGQAAMFREMATILTARGQLNQARAAIEDARSRHLLLPHRLALPEALLDMTIGAPQQSRAVVEQALTAAAETGVVAGTDELWLHIAELESRLGNQDAARLCVERIERIADELGTAEADQNRLLARVFVEGDSGAAAEVLELAAQRDRPFEFATTVTAVAERGFADRKLLLAAYEAFGELGALIPRARLRLLMRERNVAVPGRNATVAENERLLATLITEGLTNSQVATVLGTSEKSVEGRLTRFFQRTGYRSRAELATATLRGCA
ncbi:AAA family ATPase [Saccharopolyspora shandongensis]|uniref:AAA family ATPase n=1 Tax=Saccharopolyspora shandongensis TaxID=418495 RepID=UPI0015A6BBFB|nr:AAA family ATPase [Saccharopolyspora shandongensis]